MQLKLAWSLQFLCLSLSSFGIARACQHAWLMIKFYLHNYISLRELWVLYVNLNLKPNGDFSDLWIHYSEKAIFWLKNKALSHTSPTDACRMASLLRTTSTTCVLHGDCEDLPAACISDELSPTRCSLHHYLQVFPISNSCENSCEKQKLWFELQMDGFFKKQPIHLELES